jgi:hypothetical protein
MLTVCVCLICVSYKQAKLAGPPDADHQASSSFCSPAMWTLATPKLITDDDLAGARSKLMRAHGA